MNTTHKIVKSLTESNQDFEWYPTTQAMLEVVKRWIPDNAESIMDIGAGDGRALKSFGEKARDCQLYSIEMSKILSDAQPEKIIPVGSDFFEQNLSCLEVDYIFCNPPYSQYAEWVVKIILEGYAKKSFLVIPQRWSDNAEIADALKKRGAETRVIHTGDFRNAERQARAVIDIVEITYPTNKYGRKPADPFDIWFDAHVKTFDTAEEVPDYEDRYTASKNLANKFSSANIDEMVEEYRREYNRMVGNYEAIFKMDYSILKELGINKNDVREGLKKRIEGLKKLYWKNLFNKMDAITARLTANSRKKILEKLTRNTKIEFTAGNAYSVVIWTIKNVNQYIDKQMVELFGDLSNGKNALNYKSNVKTWVDDKWRYNSNTPLANSHYKLDYLIVVSKSNAIKNKDNWISHNYTNELNNTCHELIGDVIAVMRGLGFALHGADSYEMNWEAGKWNDFYTLIDGSAEILFQAKAHVNGNLHFRFMPAAMMALNISVARILKWVKTKADVVKEIGCTEAEAEKYISHNPYITRTNIKLLGAG